MTTQRFAAGMEFQDELAEWLRSREWEVQEIGQGTLLPATRARVQALSMAIARMPDFIVSKRIRGGSHRVVMIDAKGKHPTTGDTGNHSAEIGSVQFLHRLAAMTNVPTYLVFDDYCIATPGQASEHGRRGPIHPGPGRGSRKPYLLIPCQCLRKADALL